MRVSRLSQHRGGLTLVVRGQSPESRLFHPTNWSARTWGPRAVLPSFEVEWAFHPCSISSKETNNRGENYHEGDCGDGSGRGTGRHEAGGAPQPPAAINDVIVQIHASGYVPTETEWPSTWT